MAALDAKHVLADTQEIMEIGLRLSLAAGYSMARAAVARFRSDGWFPSPASPPSSAHQIARRHPDHVLSLLEGIEQTGLEAPVVVTMLHDANQKPPTGLVEGFTE